MFISDVEKEIEMLMAEGYIEAKEYSPNLTYC